MQRVIALILLCAVSSSTHAQWTNHYPRVDGFYQQIYLEGFELPVLNAGPLDPAPSPDGAALAFAARGWLWVMDLKTGLARRVTQSKGMDSRPEWSPDSRKLVFVRDTGRRLSIVMLDTRTHEERSLVDADTVNLDPSFTSDGRSVYYASAESGQLQLWRVDTSSLSREQVTRSGVLVKSPLKRRPIAVDDGLILYLEKQGTKDAIKLLNLKTGTSTTLVQDRITAQADFALSPDGKYVAYTWPYDGGWELRLLALESPDTSVLLTRSLGMPLAPAFSSDGDWLYFAEADREQRTALKRISTVGGSVRPVLIGDWDWGISIGQLIVRTKIAGQVAPVRMSAVDASGHPVIPERGMVRMEGQHGRVFFYSDGEIELIAPAGAVTVSAVQGFETTEATSTFKVVPKVDTAATMSLQRVWDASSSGWYSGDNHLHLNYGGPYRLDPDDILSDLRGEGLDIAWPLLANLHNRLMMQEFWGWRHEKQPQLYFGQEVRSHFFGHLQLLGIDTLFWPWFWGPNYDVYATDDRPNASALRYAREHGGIGGYVHPMIVSDPFTAENAELVPVGFVADAVLGEVDLIEVACLWSDEVGTSALWHAVLNLGIPVSASGGSDVMSNYYHTMAIGATRVYVAPEGPLTAESYLKALKAGHSFVSNGPMLEFSVGGEEPGSALRPAGGTAEWNLKVHSSLPYESAEIIVNGNVVATLEGSPRSGSRTYHGSVSVPVGGWITARVSGKNTGWPALDSYLYAESNPVWFHAKGTTDPAAVQRSARQLLNVLDVSERKLKSAYQPAPIPRLLEHFERARARLKLMSGG